jgi:hypothetical protein
LSRLSTDIFFGFAAMLVKKGYPFLSGSLSSVEVNQLTLLIHIN